MCSWCYFLVCLSVILRRSVLQILITMILFNPACYFPNSTLRPFTPFPTSNPFLDMTRRRGQVRVHFSFDTMYMGHLIEVLRRRLDAPVQFAGVSNRPS